MTVGDPAFTTTARQVLAALDEELDQEIGRAEQPADRRYLPASPPG